MTAISCINARKLVSVVAGQTSGTTVLCLTLCILKREREYFIEARDHAVLRIAYIHSQMVKVCFISGATGWLRHPISSLVLLNRLFSAPSSGAWHMAGAARLHAAQLFLMRLAGRPFTSIRVTLGVKGLSPERSLLMDCCLSCRYCIFALAN